MMNKEELTQIVDGLVHNLDIMINNSPSCLKLISAKGELIMMNKTGLDLIEAEDMESVFGADVYSIVEESHRQKFINFNERVCNGASGRLIFEIIGLKGTRRWMETHASPYMLPNGKIAQIAITNDITELKVKKELDELISSIREKYISYNETPKLFYDYILKEVLEHFKVEFGFLAEVAYDRELPYLRSYAISNISWNDASRKIYEELKDEGLIFDDLDSLFGEVIKTQKFYLTNDPKNDKKAKGLPPGHPELKSFLSVPLFQAGKLKATLGLANRVGGFNESLVELYNPLFQCIGELVGLFQLQQQNLQNERTLIDLNCYLDLALEGSNLGVWEWNFSDNSVRFDKRYLDMLGVDETNVEHDFSFWKARVHPDDLEVCLKRINDYLEGKTNQFVNPHRLKHSDGHWVYVLATSKFSAWDSQGKPTRMTGTHMDITLQKRQELELIEARNKALLAEKAKTLFLANMSHEIRTPMNGVIGMLDLLNETELNDSQREMIATIQYCGDSLMTILNDILDLTKIESGKLHLEQIEFNLVKLATEIISLFEAECMKKGIKLSLKNSLSHHLYFGDLTRIKQIMTNLVSNAVKFTKQGEVEVIISSRRISSSVAEIEMMIRDTGIGIPQEVQKMLFSDFMQADNSITREYGGTGLGLSITKRLVRLMKGTIAVYSDIGVGSDFVVNLPLNFASKSVQETEPEVIDITVFNHLKVLVVEDNEINCNLINAMMSKLKVKHDIVNDGQEAVKLIGSDNPYGYSLILMDLQMPIMDGYKAATLILSHCLINCPRIVPITANVFDDDRLRCRSLGMVDYLPKPITMRALTELLSRMSS